VLLLPLNSYFFGDALQNAKQLFSVKLLLMTKYYVMRECENILNGYLYVDYLVSKMEFKGTLKPEASAPSSCH
jgi:hypothetical protein